MKKIMALIMVSVILCYGLTACAPAATAGMQSLGSDDKLQIVTTIFPEYDWVMNVLGDNPAGAEVTMLLDNGVDLHSYQPTADDILKIAGCDLFIYVGGESDGWVDDALHEAVNKDMKVLNLMEIMGDSAKAEELVEGMQESEHDHDHDHDHEEEAEEHDHEEGEAEEHEHEEGEAEEHEHVEGEREEHDHEEGEAEEHEHDHEHEEGEVEYDEHVWLSLKNAAVFTEKISEAIAAIDPDNAGVYEANSKEYTEKLMALDEEYTDVVTDAKKDTVLFGDRFPFRYLTDDYGLTYYAAFIGCSAETEASFETVTFLANKVDELSLNAVMTIEGNDHRIAETVVENTQNKDQKILTLDSMQATTSEDVANGAKYYDIMKNNLAVLKEALD
ncbi:MAG: metal ABC transporter substrate-binding protein [Lachnospiraceae bacterium]|nr:metal ABC transporter substrate-binding protein [Lachnospiraceae bacterium]